VPASKSIPPESAPPQSVPHAPPKKAAAVSARPPLGLTERAKAIQQQLISEGVVHPKRGVRLPVGVTQPNVPGAPRIVTVGDATAYKAIQSGRIPLEPGEVLGPPPQFDKFGKLLPESHVEGLGAAHAQEVYGATGGEIGTVPQQCQSCAEMMTGSGWTHTNPKKPR